MLGRPVVGLSELEEELGLQPKSLGDIPEPGLTYEMNAGLKAKQIAEAIFNSDTNGTYTIITDDSGLEMCGVSWLPGNDLAVAQSYRLQGRPFPGVDTKQFIEANDSEKEAFAFCDAFYEILGIERRVKAVTVLAVQEASSGVMTADPLFYYGTVMGTFQWPPRGTNGFCYDVVFQPDGSDKTFAEMTTEEKCQVSHRRRAIAALRLKLDES